MERCNKIINPKNRHGQKTESCPKEFELIKEPQAKLVEKISSSRTDYQLEEPLNGTLKRHLPVDSDRSDNESEQIKRKKKKKQNKKQIAVSTVEEKKGAKSMRQIKKEKFHQRQIEANEAARTILKDQCLFYLKQWKNDKSNWKFAKAKQLWIYKNKFNEKMIPVDIWPVFLEYFSSAQGNIKKMILDDAKKVIAQMDEILEKEQHENDNEESTDEVKIEDTEKPSELAYRRARDIIQTLED